MIELPTTDTDAPAFIHRVTSIINTEVAACLPEEVYVVQIDHAFDHKWLGYSGNPVQHLAVWKLQLTLPPFHPNRVIFQRRFVRAASKPVVYVREGSGEPLHLKQRSSTNLNRDLRRVARSALFVWYSGKTEKTGRGTLMLYYCMPAFTDKWFAAFRRDDDWQILKHRTVNVAAE
jgi:hypothetical protein